MIDVTLTINGTDIHSLLSKYSVNYVYESVKKITTMDGTEHLFGRRRPEVKFTLIPLTDAQCSAVYTMLQSYTFQVIYTDPNVNTDRTAQFSVQSNLEAAFGLRSVDGNRYYKEKEIVLRQLTAI